MISAVGLFCYDKFEETPEKVVNLSKLTKPYFSILARVVILIQKNWNSFVTHPLFFKVYHLRIQLFLTADSGSVSYQNKFYGLYIWNSYVVNRSFYGKRNYLTVYLKHWSKLRHYQHKLSENEILL